MWEGVRVSHRWPACGQSDALGRRSCCPGRGHGTCPEPPSRSQPPGSGPREFSVGAFGTPTLGPVRAINQHDPAHSPGESVGRLWGVRGPRAGDNVGSSGAAAAVKHRREGLVAFGGIEKGGEGTELFLGLSLERGSKQDVSRRAGFPEMLQRLREVKGICRWGKRIGDFRNLGENPKEWSTEGECLEALKKQESASSRWRRWLRASRTDRWASEQRASDQWASSLSPMQRLWEQALSPPSRMGHSSSQHCRAGETDVTRSGLCHAVASSLV